MKTSRLFWVHEYGLSLPADKAAAQRLGECRFIHIWDDAYLQTKDYSLKRLAFIYQTLTTLPVDIIAGDTLEVLCHQPEVNISIPDTVDPFIRNIGQSLVAKGKSVEWIETAPFVYLKHERHTSRFFNYWKQAERSAFLQNGGKQ